MPRIIRPIREDEKNAALDLIYESFSDWRDDAEGKIVCKLTQEIRAKRYYVPELEIVCADEDGTLLGYCMFSRFHLEGKFEDELLLLTPVCVRPSHQRQHISKDMIEYGFAQARAMGFTAAIVEGNPANYNPRGFVTAAEHGILPGKTVHLPNIRCLMAIELAPGAFKTVQGHVEYDCYQTLMEE